MHTRHLVFKEWYSDSLLHNVCQHLLTEALEQGWAEHYNPLSADNLEICN